MLRLINILTYTIIVLVAAAQSCLAQEKKTQIEKEQGNIYMTWNKDTPESEMNDDIKALAEYGVTITYSDVKRNDKNEITGLKMTYADKNGNKGALELNNQKPINTIRLYKNGDEIGFGSPSNAPEIAFGGDLMDGQSFMKNFNFSNGPGQSYSFSFPEGLEFGDSQRIIIKEGNKKPLIIENGEVIEGGEDYTAEEIEKIKKGNKTKIYSYGGFGNNFRNLEDLEELKDLGIELDRKGEGQNELSKDELNKTRDEMIKAKEEMIKAKKEMEKAKKDLQKAKSSLKTQKA